MFGLDKLIPTPIGHEHQHGPVTVHGHQLRCQVCRHSEFWEHHVQLHTPAATFFNVEFMNRIANCAVCASCGYVHFLLPTDVAPDEAKQSMESSGGASDP